MLNCLLAKLAGHLKILNELLSRVNIKHSCMVQVNIIFEFFYLIFIRKPLHFFLDVLLNFLFPVWNRTVSKVTGGK